MGAAREECSASIFSRHLRSRALMLASAASTPGTVLIGGFLPAACGSCLPGPVRRSRASRRADGSSPPCPLSLEPKRRARGVGGDRRRRGDGSSPPLSASPSTRPQRAACTRRCGWRDGKGEHGPAAREREPQALRAIIACTAQRRGLRALCPHGRVLRRSIGLAYRLCLPTNAARCGVSTNAVSALRLPLPPAGRRTASRAFPYPANRLSGAMHASAGFLPFDVPPGYP